jgi:hypothetical protein
MPKPRRHTPAVAPAPHSWCIESWPAEVWPHVAGKARYVIRAHRDALVQAGALVRLGRELVILGGPYSKYLESQASRVDGFATIAPNRSPAVAGEAAA